MGANCCVAAKSTSSVSRTGVEATLRNDIYSPSWSFRWDNRTHTEEPVSSHFRFSHGNSTAAGSEIKSSVDTEPEGISDGDSPFLSFQTSSWQKSPSFGRDSGSNVKAGERDLSIESASSAEEKDNRKLSTKHGRLTNKSVAYSPSPSVPIADPCPSRSCSLPSGSSSMRKIHGSPSVQISRQISDSHIPFHASHLQGSPAEARQSFVLPSYASDLSTGGSNLGSSENWSVRLFSELIAFSQRDRLSVDGDGFCFGHGKISGSNRQLASPASLQRCGLCSKLLKERSPWSGRKLVSNDVPVAAVLVCGHVYHADCLDKVTSEVERFDPSCPVCANGGKPISKMQIKAELKSKNKISKTAVASIDLENDTAIDGRKGPLREVKGLRLGASSSMKGSGSKHHFLKRHFSLGSKMLQTSSENEGNKKKGFWFRHG